MTERVSTVCRLANQRHVEAIDRLVCRAPGDEALDDIAARHAALMDAHGPEVVADYTGTGGPLDPSGYALTEGFLRNLGSHQRYSALSIDCPAKFLVP